MIPLQESGGPVRTADAVDEEPCAQASLAGSIVPDDAATTRVGGLLDRWARRQVLAGLRGLRDCRLLLSEGAVEHLVGEGPHQPIHIRVHRPVFWSRLAFGGTVEAGESYRDGDWDCEDLTGLVRILCRNRAQLDGLDAGWVRLREPLRRLAHWLRRNTRTGSRRNIQAHYDIGNDLFERMLGPAMAYSANVYDTSCPGRVGDAAALAAAERRKFVALADRLDCRPGDHVLEIGCGWGGFACYLAEERGCRVTAVTISPAQFAVARSRIAAAGLADRIDCRLQDYRDITGHFARIVSVEMIEAVGHQYYRAFFGHCRRLLAPDGLLVMQAITIADQLFDRAKREVDFIKRCIFPGSCIPSVTALLEAATGASDLRLIELSDLTPHYARTLADWRSRCVGLSQELSDYDARFWRLWDFYLSYCEGGFAERAIGLVHLVWAADGYRQPDHAALGYGQS